MSSSNQPTLLIIDGHSLAFRAFYALSPDNFQTRAGQHTNAVHGFISMLLTLLRNENPTHLAVAFDLGRHSFRTDEYPEYKGTRGETPPEFNGQTELLREALAAMNIVTLTKVNYEADDILATLSFEGRKAGLKVLVVSGDRDTIQLINDDVTLLYPIKGVNNLLRYDAEAVIEKYGIAPENYPDLAALVGETSDNLPGIPGVGPKTAAKWIQKYGPLDEILAHADDIAGKVGESLRENREEAVRNRRLNRLLTDLELPITVPELERVDLDSTAVREVFEKLEFKTLLERVLRTSGEAHVAVSGDATEPPATAPISPAAELVSSTASTSDGASFVAWLDARTPEETVDGLALAVELTESGLSSMGIASATHALTLDHDTAAPLSAELVAWLESDAPKVSHDSKRAHHALLDVLRPPLDGALTPNRGSVLGGVVFDSLLAAWLVKPTTAKWPLADLVAQHLDEELPQADPNQLVPEAPALTAGGEAWYIKRVAASQKAALAPSSLGVLEAIDLPLIPVLAAIEHEGITVSRPVLSTLSEELGAKAADLAGQAYASIGHEVNLASPKQLQQVLFEELEMPKTRALKTGYSTDADSLAELQQKAPHPFLDHLAGHRDSTKLLQIIETLTKAIGPDERIHSTFVQTGTSTGRISSADPNLQNIPVKTAEGRRIRSAFTHAPQYSTLLTADYSQIEMRIMAHLSGDADLILAFNEGEDLHRFVGSRIFGVEPQDVTPTMRTKVKAMSYGLVYGLGQFGLSKQLSISVSEAKQLMQDYFSRFGAVRDYLRDVVEKARVDGFTETIDGRRRPFPELNSHNRVVREGAARAALNAPIQGSAADIMKRAMTDIHGDLIAGGLTSRMLLQVHDELIFEVADGEGEALEAIVINRMHGAANLTVPLDVQVGHGANWDAAAH